MIKGYVGKTQSYTPIEYIESSGTQYIDTGVVRDITKKFEFKGSFNYSDVSTRQAIGAQGYVYLGVTSGYYQIAQGGTTHTSATATANTFINFDIVFDCPNSTCSGTINNQTISSFSVTYQDNPVNAHICLFSLNDLNLPSRVKIANWQIYEDDVLVRDFIPVIDQDGIACLYELVEGKFYYNNGTGTFIAGQVTGQTVPLTSVARKLLKGYVGIPASYTPVEYIESTGTQYIDTGLSASNGFHVEIDISFADFGTVRAITGCYDNGPQRFILRTNTDNTVVTHFGGYSGNNLITGPTLTANERYLINAVMFNGNQSLSVNNVSYGTRTISGQTFPNVNLYLLAIWSLGYAQNFVSGKLYSAKYYDDSNNLLRNFIPALDQDNVACLYEQVEGKFYYNAGTGSFTAGSATGQSVSVGSLARKIIKGYVGVNGVARPIYTPMTPLNYIQANGTQYIETGVNATQTLRSQMKVNMQAVTGDVVYGFSTSGDTNDYRLFNYQNKFWFDMPPSSGRISGGTWNNGTDYNIEIGNFYVKNLDTGTTIISSSTRTFGQQSNTMKVFFSGYGSHYSKGKLYYLKIYDGDTLLRDFIPVLDGNGVPCLYDNVSQTFYYNQGTGTFLYG